MRNILIIEDDKILNKGVAFALKKEGYNVISAYTKQEGKTAIDNNEIDFLLLDITLPDGSGLDLCKEIKTKINFPIVFFTANDTEEDMIKGFDGINPTIDNSAFVAESADIIGDVVIEKDANIWYNTVLRGDANKIIVGENSNVQDGSIVHCGEESPTIIGKNVTIGHGAIIHGCNISDNVLVGMGSIILNNAKIGKNTIIGAGSLITQGKEFPEGVLILGNPAKVIRELTKVEIESIKKSADNYVSLSKKYKK